MTLQAQRLQGLRLAVEGLVDGHDVVRLGRGGVDGRAAESAEPLLLQQQLPQVAPVPARLQERSEDLAGGRGEALAPVAEVQLGHPLPEHLRVLGVLVHDAVAALGPQAQVAPLHQAAHRDVGLVPLPQQLCPGHVQVLAPEVPGLDLPAPLLPLPEEGHAGLPALAPVAGLVPRFRITEGHGAGVAVEEGVVAVDAAGHGPLLPDGRLVAVEHLPAAVDDVQRRLAPGAELPDLGPGDALALPVLGTNGVEVRVDLVVGQAQQLRELAHHAEPILPLLEGALQNFGAPEELVGHVPQHAQAPVQRHLGLDPIVHHLHRLLRHGPVPRPIIKVGLLGDLHDHGAVFGVAHLAQSGGDDVAVRLHLAQRVVLAPQPVQRHGQEGLPLVGPAVAAPPADPDRHVGQVIGPLVSEEALPQLGHAVVAVRLQAAHRLLGAARRPPRA